MIPRSNARRKLMDHAVMCISVAAALIGILALAAILFEVCRHGAAAINWPFFFHRTMSAGTVPDGVGNAIVGSLLMIALGTLAGVPVGMLAGVYLAEFGRGSRLADAVRFSANVLMGVPSIIVGLFVYALVVAFVPSHAFSGWAGAAALAILMIPLVARTTEDMLELVPNSLRESALALGSARWKVVIGVLFRAAKSGLLTGVLLAVARISGETAPLLFTALNSFYWPWPWPAALNGPTANLPVLIFDHAMSPYPDWQSLAWGASLIITVGVLAVNVSTRLIVRRGSHG